MRLRNFLDDLRSRFNLQSYTRASLKQGAVLLAIIALISLVQDCTSSSR